MDDLSTLKKDLAQKSPEKRVKFLRQKILQKNQAQFCEDGIIRMGTLKLIESERMKISRRIAERLVHKFYLAGVVCGKELFLDPESHCDLRIDDTRQKIIGTSGADLEEIRKKLSSLTPIPIDKSVCPELIPNGATALARELKENDLTSLNKTLCLVHGTKIVVSSLTYENDHIVSEYNGKIERFPANIIQFCGMYAIEILYFNK